MSVLALVAHSPSPHLGQYSLAPRTAYSESETMGAYRTPRATHAGLRATHSFTAAASACASARWFVWRSDGDRGAARATVSTPSSITHSPHAAAAVGLPLRTHAPSQNRAARGSMVTIS